MEKWRRVDIVEAVEACFERTIEQALELDVAVEIEDEMEALLACLGSKVLLAEAEETSGSGDGGRRTNFDEGKAKISCEEEAGERIRSSSDAVSSSH